MGSQRWVFPYIRNRMHPPCVHGGTERGTVYLSGQEGRWKQFHIKCSLISTPQWHHSPHSGLLWVHKATNMMPIKVDPAQSMVFLNSTKVWLLCVAKTEFQFLHYYFWFLQIQSYIYRRCK